MVSRDSDYCKSRLIKGVPRVLNNQRERIAEDRSSFIERYPMLPHIGSSLHCVPFEPKRHSRNFGRPHRPVASFDRERNPNDASA